jgi:hypothetical protein
MMLTKGATFRHTKASFSNKTPEVIGSMMSNSEGALRGLDNDLR